MVFVIDECFAKCVDKDGFTISKDNDEYLEAMSVQSMWCESGKRA